MLVCWGDLSWVLHKIVLQMRLLALLTGSFMEAGQTKSIQMTKVAEQHTFQISDYSCWACQVTTIKTDSKQKEHQEKSRLQEWGWWDCWYAEGHSEHGDEWWGLQLNVLSESDQSTCKCRIHLQNIADDHMTWYRCTTPLTEEITKHKRHEGSQSRC